MLEIFSTVDLHNIHHMLTILETERNCELAKLFLCLCFDKNLRRRKIFTDPHIRRFPG